VAVVSDELDVDGTRPAVVRVAALPGYWTSESERLVLLVLACDSFDGVTSTPGNDLLASWVGMHRSSVIVILNRLCKPTETRPALLERVVASRGRRRTTYRFRFPDGVGLDEEDEPPADGPAAGRAPPF
jgi:hypothetical protein